MTEEIFLKNYDPDKYKKPSVTVDIAVFAVGEDEVDNYRKISDKSLKILLIKRGQHPYKDCWALPGGFVGIEESLEEAAYRELFEETHVKGAYLEQLYTWGDVQRDPRMRVISTSYMSLVRESETKIQGDSDATQAKWFFLDYTLIKETKELREDGQYIEKEYRLTMSDEEHSFEIAITQTQELIGNKMTKNMILGDNPLAFDHGKIILYALERLKNKAEYSDIAFRLMPEYFTLTQLQQIYEIILGKPLLKANFRRKIADMVIETDIMSKNAGHRPSKLYKFNLEWKREV